MKKHELILFKSWYGKISIKQLIPILNFSKNVQGWYYTRNWSLYWFTYCLNYSITIADNLDKNHVEAHENNVTKYMI